MKRLAFHGSVLIHHLFVGYFALHQVDFSTTVDKQVLDMNRYRFRFLTGWNFNMQTFYFLVCVIEDLRGLGGDTVAETKRKLRAFKSFVFTALVFPATFFVSLMFWALYAYNRELVYPTAADDVMPGWLNHAIHTNITIVIMLEMLMSYHWYHKRKIAMLTVNAYMGIYVCCLLYTYIFDGDWIYPIFGHMDWSQRIIFYLVVHILVMAFYMIGELLHSIIWSEKIRRKINEKRQRLQARLEKSL